MSELHPTAGQTVGPFFGFALPYDGAADLVPAGSPGARRLSGVVRDGAGDPVPDALLELTVTAVGGERLWGRAATDAEGRYAFTVPEPDGAFLGLTVFARGLLNRLFTRVYLPGAGDAFLAGLAEDRRPTLVARAVEEGYAFDVHLQGDDETVFLTYPRHLR
ncbi:protocatechuate 3,4-dioxygenase subunit alpha [Nocardioides anomalus]|uniref:Protocatechuate 3,4-dioxygenase subunit alpha n=1 Tax=Nocardioides anomalus TaxID=2712223 RepID=A0A6G6WE53_9ACTN|nr:protocatechuate 3,4-dioxygenase subunit alpha [Nocardioides anomalus]QIG43320.1 protocatechuate 3,4-dioxygenase subunit alpha [Nocardioides anomalus]